MKFELFLLSLPMVNLYSLFYFMTLYLNIYYRYIFKSSNNIEAGEKFKFEFMELSLTHTCISVCNLYITHCPCLCEINKYKINLNKKCLKFWVHSDLKILCFVVIEIGQFMNIKIFYSLVIKIQASVVWYIILCHIEKR